MKLQSSRASQHAATEAEVTSMLGRTSTTPKSSQWLRNAAILVVALVVLCFINVIEIKPAGPGVDTDMDAIPGHVQKKIPKPDDANAVPTQAAPVPTEAAPAPVTTPSPTNPAPAPTDPLPDAPPVERHTYTRRGQPMSDADRQAMIDKWGQWTFVDPNPERRPNKDVDMFALHPHGDMPRDQFPEGSWQLDATYLEGFLTQGLELVTRTQNAILEEY